MMTKADRIRNLLDLSTPEIAALTGYAQPYIRAVRQRTDAEGKYRESRADANYWNHHRQKIYERRIRRDRVRYHEDEWFRLRRLDYNAKWRRKQRELAHA